MSDSANNKSIIHKLLLLLFSIALIIFAVQGVSNPDQQPVPVEPVMSVPHQHLLSQLQQQYPKYMRNVVLIVDVSEQRMYQYNGNQLLETFAVSTASNGVGSVSGSGKTPLGAHRISNRYGDKAPLGTIFKARRNTGKIAKIIKEPIDIASDAVTTRILWLDGLEPKKNKGGRVDSKRRYIYIHGTPEEGLIGQPASHGCIRMYNEDVIRLFDQTPVNSLVYIQH